MEQLTVTMKGTGLVYSSAELMGMKRVLMMEMRLALQTVQSSDLLMGMKMEIS